jgi:hypothetical protein
LRRSHGFDQAGNDPLMDVLCRIQSTHQYIPLFNLDAPNNAKWDGGLRSRQKNAGAEPEDGMAEMASVTLSTIMDFVGKDLGTSE